MTELTSAYNYRKAVLGKLAAPSSMAATPDLGEITQARSAAVAQTKTQDEKLARDVTYGEKALTEKNREFDAQMTLDRERLDAWAEQNKWATGIAIANLGLTGLSFAASIKSADRQEALLKDVAQSYKANVAATVQGTETMAADLQTYKDEAAAAARAAAERSAADAAVRDRITGELNARLEYARVLEEARMLTGTDEMNTAIGAVQKKTQEGAGVINAYDRSLSDAARRRTLH